MATMTISGGATSRPRSSPGRAASEQERAPPALPGRGRQGREERRQEGVQRLHRGVAQGRSAVRRRPRGRGRGRRPSASRPSTTSTSSPSSSSPAAWRAAWSSPPAHDETQGRRPRRPRRHDPHRLSSATREVVIGFDRPFIDHRRAHQPDRPEALAEEMKAGDFSRVERDAIAQVEAGAHMLDVNAGIPLADEPAILARTIQLVQSLTDVPLSIDSSIVEALEAGLAVYQGKALRELRDRRGGAPRARPAAGQEVRRGGRRDLERRDRHLRGPGRPVRGRPAHRRARRRPRHPARGRHRRPAGHADRGDGRRPASRCSASWAGCARSSASTRPAAPQRQLRHARPRADQRRVPADGDRLRA